MQQETSKIPRLKPRGFAIKLKRLLGSRRFRQTVGALVLLTLVWSGFTAIRVRKLKAQGEIIALVTHQFKTDYYLGAPKARLVTYLVLGDSTAAGWGAETLKATYAFKIAQAVAGQGYYVHVINFAVGGATLADVCQNQLAAVWASHPDLVTVSIGANDATSGTSESEYTEQLKVLVGTLQNSDAQAILFADTPDMFQVPALPWPVAQLYGLRARRFNLALSKIERNPKVQIVDLYNEGKLVYGQDPALYAPDLFHPSGKGYARWAALYIKKLNLRAK